MKGFQDLWLVPQEFCEEFGFDDGICNGIAYASFHLESFSCKGF